MTKERVIHYKKGDKVKMINCGEANCEKYKDKVWTCKTDSRYLSKIESADEVVWLEDFSGCFCCKYLTRV